MCDTCGRPRRELWTFLEYPELTEVAVGSWMSLRRCPACKALWCEVPHEPYASFTFLTFWPYDEATWQAVHDLDAAQTLHEWHGAVIRERWTALSAAEKSAVEKWRDRTYRHYNPIDRGLDDPQPKRIRHASDLSSVVAGV